MGIVFLSAVPWTFDEVEMALKGRIEFANKSADSADANWDLSGDILHWRHPLGFDITKLLFKGFALRGNPPESDVAINAIEELMVAAIEDIQPDFGYFSTHPNEVDNEWIEREVIIPLKDAKWHEVLNHQYHLIQYRAEATEAEFFWVGEAIYESPRGVLVRQGDSRNPYDSARQPHPAVGRGDSVPR